jgi:hypothetical protein
MSDRAYAKVQAQQKTPSGSSPKSSLLQRTSACGQHTIAGGECSTCRSEQSTLLRSQRAFGSSSTLAVTQGNSPDQENVPSFNSAFDSASRFGHDFSKIPVYSSQSPVLQTKLTVNQPGNEYEQEADRIADKVIATSADPAVSGAPPHIQRFAGQPEAPPASVDQALASPGSPLEPTLRQDMEQGFGHDFSRVRVHSGADAEQSAGDVNAHAYTVGHDIVFGAGRYAPGMHEGRRLIAHELTHVAQQEAAGNGFGYGLFRKKDEGKPQPPPPKTKAQSPTTAPPPCVPDFISLESEIFSSVGMREARGRCELILGTPGTSNGTTFTSEVDVPAGCTGTLQYVQLTDMCRNFHLTSGKDIHRKTGGDWIDTQDPIDQQKVSSAGSVEFKGNDSPGQPVAGIIERVQVKDSFKIWLMWKPDQPADANRVPLAMATWNWSAEAEVKTPDEVDCAKRWAVTQQKATGGTGKATKDSPAATKTVTSTDPPREEGKC